MKASTGYRDQVLRDALFTEGLKMAEKLTEVFQFAAGETEEADFLKRLNEAAPLIEKVVEIDRMLRGYVTEKRAP